MKKINLLILKSFIGPFLATFCVSMFLFLMLFLWKYIDELIGKGLEWHVVARLLFFSLADLIPNALPLAVLISSLMTYGNLAESYEMVAMKSSGISIYRALAPTFVVMCLLAILAFYVSNIVMPKANLEAKTLLYDVRQKKPAFNIKEGVFYDGIDNYSIKIGKKEKDNQTIKDVLIYELRPNMGSHLTVIRAASGKMQLSDDKRALFFTLNDGIRYEEMVGNRNYEKTYPANITRFDEQKITFDLSDLDLKQTDKALFKGNYQLMNIAELHEASDSLKKEIVKQSGKLDEYLKPYYLFNYNNYKFSEEPPVPAPIALVMDSVRRKRDTANKAKAPVAANLPGLLKVPGTKVMASVPDSSKISKAKVKKDTALPLVNKDIIKNFPPGKRYSILEGALNSSRSIKSLIEETTQRMDDLVSDERQYLIEWHRKFTLSFVIIVLFLIAAPLGTIIRKGGLGMPLVVSIVMFILYHIINIIGVKIGKEGIVPVYVGAWLSTILLLPLGFFVTYKASKESALFDKDAYTRFFRRINKMFNRDKFAAEQ